jgi:hypothetical protein
MRNRRDLQWVTAHNTVNATKTYPHVWVDKVVLLPVTDYGLFHSMLELVSIS